MADTSPFRPLELPTPNVFRSASGMPGPMYWQQRADYNIRASLDTATHTIRGEETLTYTNNSPDTLRYLWIQLDLNIGAPNSRMAPLASPAARRSRASGPGSPSSASTCCAAASARAQADAGRRSPSASTAR